MVTLEKNLKKKLTIGTSLSKVISITDAVVRVVTSEQEDFKNLSMAFLCRVYMFSYA